MSANAAPSSSDPGSKTTVVRVGTSGWSYPHWRGRFYPVGLATTRWLEFYAGRFDAVEVNATFYRLPTASTVDRWRDRASAEFRFVVKGSRLITHARRLDAPAAVDAFLSRIEPLGERLAAVLWQLPPDFTLDLPRLEAFVASLPAWTRHAVEFRHASWRTEAVYETLDRHRVANVAASTAAGKPDLTTTGGFAYVRLHGLEGGYAHDYTDAELRPWARHLARVGDGFAFFNNDGGACAPRNAERFVELLAPTVRCQDGTRRPLVAGEAPRNARADAARRCRSSPAS